MKNLFIDSNIWLSLYHFTSDDLTQFEKLKDFLDKDIRLWIPHQVYDEVLRNREAKIQDAFKKFEFSKIQYPVFCRQYDEYTQFGNRKRGARYIFIQVLFLSWESMSKKSN